MKWLEPFVRPRPLAWACLVLGAVPIPWVVPTPMHNAFPVVYAVVVWIALSWGIMTIGMFAHFVGVYAMESELGGPTLSCRYLLPSERFARNDAKQYPSSRKSMALGNSPAVSLMVQLWMAPDSCGWTTQRALARAYLVRPLPGIIVGWATTACLLFLSAVEWIGPAPRSVASASGAEEGA